MDSREYRLIYTVHTNSDIPTDFPKEVRHCRFEAGVFIPQDDSNWYTRPPKFPARLLLLQEKSLWIVSHPTSGQPDIDILLADLTQLETGCILLFGWMKFTTSTGVYEIVYNTRASRPLEKFVSLLRERWLGENGSRRVEASLIMLGRELDIKFGNQLHFELNREEKILVQYFQPAMKLEGKLFFVRRVSWLPAHLLVLTSGGRILWITDDYRRSREFYAGINRSAPVRVFESCRLEVLHERLHLVICFVGDNVWCIPVRTAAENASAFAQALQEQLSGLRASKTTGKDRS